MIVHVGTPVREVCDVLRAVLDIASNVVYQCGLRVIRFQGTDIIIEAAKALLPSGLNKNKYNRLNIRYKCFNLSLFAQRTHNKKSRTEYVCNEYFSPR